MFSIDTKYGPLLIPEERRELESWERDEMLAWLALNDPNGNWSEYIRNFEYAECEFGDIDEDELREKIQDMLQSRLEQQRRPEMTEQIYKYLLDNTDFELPLDIVGQQATMVLQRQYSNLIMRGLSREQIEEQLEQLLAGSEQQAERQLKTFFIMDKVAEKLDISVSEEEINGHIAQLAMQRQQRPEKMREQMERDGSLAQFSLEVRQNKCIAKLLETAEVTEKKAKKEKKSKKKAEKSPKKTAKKTSD